MKNLLAEFKEFINRGNVIDMAVGIIIGAAFTAIVTSLTDDIINPLIKLITGGNGTEVAGLTIPVPGTESGIDFGAFISAIINFLIVAWVVFM
ncbi:MAG: large conductance mechanosensitive channel protein MscL, partial [Eggerthellaceae bacterium]|nr:large conductance mechanosensitive channel protein MscL [Eggerthellaceae bacterium]